MPLARHVGCGREAVLQAARGRAAGPQARPLPDRPGRRLRGSAARGRTARTWPIKRPDGSVWTSSAGLGWTNPYDRGVWNYNVSIAEVAARAGFDEIQLDYVRFPSDGDTDGAVYPGKTATPQGWVIPQFVQYASKRLKKLGVRVSADVFGLSASRDLGIGQIPRRISRYVDAIYPMVYPSHYNPGEYGIADPNAQPGETVFTSLAHFRRELRGPASGDHPVAAGLLARPHVRRSARCAPQIESARLQDARGYLLWNPSASTPTAPGPSG